MHFKKTINWILISSFLLLMLFLFYGCQDNLKYQIPQDNTKNIELVRSARLYLQKCTYSWFIPPSDLVFGGGDGTQLNTSGAFPWADCFLLNDGGTTQETMETCNNKLYWSYNNDQESWYDYSKKSSIDGAGWPGGIVNGSKDHKAGFECFVFVAQALKDAGYDIIPESVQSCDWFAQNYPRITDAVQIGDIVLYDFDRDNSYEHVGIISDVTSTDKNYFMVISSEGIVEQFSYGVAERRLGVFGDAAHGGDFSTWKPQLEPYNTLIVRPQ